MPSQLHHIYGDNIVECVRAFEYVVAGLGDLVLELNGPLTSVSCPVYTVTLENAVLTFQFLPGYGERRWNQDVLNYVKRSGGRLREAADAIITRVHSGVEVVIAAIEFCGALPAGNQAWQRQGRAFSFAHARIPFFYVAELGGFELAAGRERKAERMPNPAIPFSFYAMTEYQESVCLPVYEANSGAKLATVERYNPIYGKAEFLEFLKLVVLGLPTHEPATALEAKCFALVELLAEAKVRQDGLTAPQWQAAKQALERGKSLPDFLNTEARLRWSKTAYIDSLTHTAREFMALGARESFGLTSAALPLSFVPKERRSVFARGTRTIYPDLTTDFETWLGREESHLAIAWVMGFKPGGDDARPDRGLPPLARMLAGDRTDLLTFVYGPAPASQWRALATSPVKLAASNGLWESIMAVSDACLGDSSTQPINTPRGHLKASWAAIQHEESVQLSVEPRVLVLGEQDVDTALHVAFESLGADIAFEGMCNPPGGDWSGISFRWAHDAPEHRWLTLPRVSAEGAKRPDHVFALFGHGESTVCLCIESKESAQKLEANIGPRLTRYTEVLFGSMPSINRAGKLSAWALYESQWASTPIAYISAGAFPARSSVTPFQNVPSGLNLDLIIAVWFIEDGRRCQLHLRGDTLAGMDVARYLKGLTSWGSFVEIVLSSQ